MTWEALADPIAAIRSALKQDAALGELVQGRVWGMEVPRQEAKSMPRECVVISPAGGPGGSPGGADHIRHQRVRVDLRCYGLTPHRAYRVALALQVAVKAWKRQTVDGVLVQSFVYSAGPFAFRDPDTTWPTVIYTYQVLCADALIS